MKTYQIVEMPKPGKEDGIANCVPLLNNAGGVYLMTIPFCCNIEKVIIFYGDFRKTKRAYERMKE